MSELCLPPADEHGLLLPPSVIDCVGDSCPVAEKSGSCFTSTHHYYWTEDYFRSSGLLRAFSRHSFNTTKMARCRHDDWHAMYDRAVVKNPRRIRPENRVMSRFLKEANFLSMLGIRLDRIEKFDMQDEFDPTELIAAHLATIEQAVARRRQIEFVHSAIAEPIMSRAVELLEAS